MEAVGNEDFTYLKKVDNEAASVAHKGVAYKPPESPNNIIQ